MLTEDAIPPTSYGYWVLPSGEIVQVGPYSHSDLSQEKLKLNPKPAIIMAAWVRVVCPPDQKWISVETSTEITSAAWYSTLKIMQKSGKETAMIDMVSDSGWRYENGDIRKMMKIFHDAVHKKVARKMTQRITEAAIPYTTYGYWILPDGSIETVSHYAHAEVASRLLQDKTVRKQNVITSHNWVRVVCEPYVDYMSIETSNRISSAAFNAVLRLMQKSGKNRVILEVLSEGTWTHNAEHFAGTVREMMTAFSEHVHKELVRISPSMRTTAN